MPPKGRPGNPEKQLQQLQQYLARLQENVTRIRAPLSRTTLQGRLTAMGERLGIIQQNLQELKEEIRLIRTEIVELEREIIERERDNEEVQEPREVVRIDENRNVERRPRGRPPGQRDPPREQIQVEIIDPNNRLREERDAQIIIDLPDVQVRRYNLRPDDVEFEEDPNIERIYRPGAGRWRRREIPGDQPEEEAPVVVLEPPPGGRGRGRPRIVGRGRGRPPGARNRDPLFRPNQVVQRQRRNIRVVRRDEIDLIQPDEVSVEIREQRIYPDDIFSEDEEMEEQIEEEEEEEETMEQRRRRQLIRFRRIREEFRRNEEEEQQEIEERIAQQNEVNREAVRGRRRRRGRGDREWRPPRRGQPGRRPPRENIDDFEAPIGPEEPYEEEIIQERGGRGRGRGRRRGRGGDREWRPRRQGGRRNQREQQLEEDEDEEQQEQVLEREGNDQFIQVAKQNNKGEIDGYDKLKNSKLTIAREPIERNEIEYVQVFDDRILPEVMNIQRNQTRIFVILPSKNENIVTQQTRIYEQNYFQGNIPNDVAIETLIYRTCEQYINNLTQMDQFFDEPDPSDDFFSSVDYAMQNLWNIQTVLNNDYSPDIIWGVLENNIDTRNIIREYFFNRNFYYLMDSSDPNQTTTFNQKMRILFRAAWIDKWQEGTSEEIWNWIQEQPIWKEFALQFEQEPGFAEMFANPCDLLYFLTNLSFYHDQIAFDSNSNFTRFAYNTAILQQLKWFYDPDSSHRNKMEYVRLMKCDLFFTVRLVTLVAVLLIQQPDTVRLRRCQIFLTGDLEVESILHVTADENGELEDAPSRKITGFPLFQIFSCIMELMNKPFQNNQYMHPDLIVGGGDRALQINRARSQIFMRSAQIQLDQRKSLNKYYYRGQDNGRLELKSHNLNRMKRNLTNPESYTFVQAVTTQIGQYALQSRVLDDQDDDVINIYDPQNFKKLAAVLEIMIKDIMGRSDYMNQISVQGNRIWMRIDCQVNFEIDPHNGMQVVRERHYVGGSFKIGTAIFKRISQAGRRNQNAQQREEHLQRNRLVIARILLAKILRIDNEVPHSDFGLPNQTTGEYDEILSTLELDQPENEELYESGVSLDELVEIYRRMRQLAQNRHELEDLEQKEAEDLEKLDYGEDQRMNPDARPNIYKLRMERLVGFTATVRNLNLVVYKRETDAQNQWWALRSMIKNQMSNLPIEQNQWEKIDRLRWQREGKMHVQIRKYQCETWTLIETLFSNYFCGQHLCVYLMMLGGFVSEAELVNKTEKTTSASIGELSDFLEMWSVFETLIANPFEIKKVIIALRGLQSNQEGNFVEKEIHVNYPGRRKITLGTMLIIRPFADFELYFDNGHIIPVSNKNLQPLVAELIGKPFDEKFQSLFEEKQKSSFPVPVCVPSSKQTDKQQLKNIEIYENFDRDVELHNFYIENFKERNIKSNNNYFCWIDLETTTKMNVGAMDKHKMNAYILACKFQALDQSNPSPFGNLIRDGESWVFDGERCIELFVQKLKSVYFRILRDGNESRKLIISAWNGRKFDFQFFIEKLYRMFPHDFTLIGTMTNTKTAAIGEHIEFWDAMDMVSPMSLAKFCKSMQEPGKFDGSMMFKIKTLDDWTSLKQREPKKAQELIDYCLQDVVCMSKSMTKFNEMIYSCLKMMLGDILKNDSGFIPWILEKTMAKLAYKIFTNQIIPSSCAPTALITPEMYQAVTECYRGGFVLSFIFGKIDIKTNPHIKHLNYIDINSLYPFVMANSFIPVSYCVTPQKYNPIRNSHINPRSIYKMTMFDIGEDIHFGFFGVRVFNDQGQFTKVIYPTKWEAHEKQKQLWVFGTELILFRQVFGRGKFTLESYYECTSQKRLFRPIKMMYDKRVECKTRNPPMAESLKLLMNSCYGRFGMKAYELCSYIHELQLDGFSPDQQDLIIQSSLRKHNSSQKRGTNQTQEINPFENLSTIKTFNNDQILKFTVKKENTYLPSSQTQRLKHVAAWIATQARCRLLATIYQLRRETQVEVLYCDTDSIVYGAKTQNQMEKVLNLKTFWWHQDHFIKDTSFCSAVEFNTDLGGMKSEIEKDEEMVVFQAFGPKFYRYSKRKKGTDEEKWINKSKGINQNLRSVEDEKVNGRMNDLRQILFFEEYQKSLNAQIYQQYIRSKKGQMFVEKTVKENRFNLTRKFSQNHPKNKELLNYTIPFVDIQDFKHYNREKIPVLDQNLNQYTYIDVEQ